MSDQREVEITIGSEAFTKLPKKEQKARIARIFDRNLSTDKFKVALPPDVYGEWIPSDPISLQEAELKGFRVDDTYAPKSTAFKSNRYIDVIHMIMPQSTKDLIDEVKAEEYNRVHNPKKQEGKIEDQVEDRHTGKQAQDVGLPIISETTTKIVNSSQIQSALKGGT